jgi:hypothetical protein
MKSLKWAATLGIVGMFVILFINRDDVMRYQKMRQMWRTTATGRTSSAVPGA